MRFALLILLALALSACRYGVGAPVKDSLIQSNVDFDYLGDDDDDDDAGGAGGAVFDATIPALVTSAAVGVAIGFQADAIAGGVAQTSGSVKITVSEGSGALASAPITTALAGWSESGWSYAAGIWSNTITRAAVPTGATSPTFQVTATSGGSGGGFVVATNTVAPKTAEATGAGNSRLVLITAVSFNAVGSAPASTVANGSFTWTVDITAGGASQTNGQVTLTAGAYSHPVASVVTTGLAGWAESGWVYGFNSSDGLHWRNTLTRTSVSIGTTSPTFTVNVSTITAEDSHTITLNTFASGYPPQTTEATGVGNSVAVAVS